MSLAIGLDVSELRMGHFDYGNPGLPQRFWAKVQIGKGGCWLWTAAINRGGYGVFRAGSRSDGTRRQVTAHRYAYFHLAGDIPEGLVIDHLCRVKHCVNPAHMEPVTTGENTRRGINHQSSKTHCINGHPFDAENTQYTSAGRRCGTCNRERVRAWREAHKETE